LRELLDAADQYYPAIDPSAAAWCDRFPVSFIELNRMGEESIEI